MSGIPGMGQRWQAALKIRMIMIPLPENTAVGAASGVCCSVEGCCRASGSRPDGPAYSGPHWGRENKNPWQGVMPCLGVWGYFVEKGRLIYRLWRKDNHIHQLYDTVSQS